MTTGVWDFSTQESPRTEKELFLQGFELGLASFVVAIIGALMNFYLFTIMTFGNVKMHPAACILLRFQLFIDGFACTFLAMAQFEIPKPLDDDVTFWIFCLIFERNGALWFCYACSAFNIVAITLQRFTIVVFPFKKVNNVSAYVSIFIVFVCSLCLNGEDYGLTLYNSPSEKICKAGALPFVGIIWTVTYYCLPTIIVVISYTVIIKTLIKSSKIVSSKNKKSENKIHLNAIIVSLLFVILCGPSSISYPLLSYGFIKRQIWEAFLRILTYVCIMLNSASTPVIFVIFLSNVREKTFLKVFSKPKSTPTISVNSTETRSTHI